MQALLCYWLLIPQPYYDTWCHITSHEDPHCCPVLSLTWPQYIEFNMTETIRDILEPVDNNNKSIMVQARRAIVNLNRFNLPIAMHAIHGL